MNRPIKLCEQPMAVRRPSMAIASVHDALYIGYSLSYGHQGTRPCSPHHREVAEPVGSPVDLGVASGKTERSPFPLLAASSVVRPMTRGTATY